jgi:von Willebrand factor A domain-containing protein 8
MFVYTVFRFGDRSTTLTNKIFVHQQRQSPHLLRRHLSAPPTIRIGNVERIVADPSRLTIEQRRKIPKGYVAQFMNDPVAQSHLQWLIQKDLLQQDCILVGAIGGDTVRRRRIAMAYAELTQQPVELLTLSPDTAESDLKQRRSLFRTNNSDGTDESQIIFKDQAPVRAAIHGHLLILDGLHRTERNVLPTLNNLLENREMPLEDGRLLVSANRYKYLQQQQSDNPINQFLVPVHHNFKVLALLSYDPNSNRRLDPPVRSRFQIRRVDPVPTDILYDQLLVAEEVWLATNTISQDEDDTINIDNNNEKIIAPYMTSETSAKQLAVFATAMMADTSKKNTTTSTNDDTGITGLASNTIVGRIPFPLNTMSYIQRVRNRFPYQPLPDLFERMYPYGTSETRLFSVFKKWSVAVTSREAFQRVYREMKLLSSQYNSSSTADKPVYEYIRTEPIPDDPQHIQLHFTYKQRSNEIQHQQQITSIKVKAVTGGYLLNDLKPSDTFISTTGSKHVLSAMLQEHSVGRDILLISPKGEGKNVIAQHFCDITGYHVHLFPLYKEMTANDLLLRRTTTNNNDNNNLNKTTDPQCDWSESPLLLAARTGQVCILDGVEKLSRDCFATLQAFFTDREVSLPDGTKYIHPASSEDVPTKIRSSFRVIALASINPSGSYSTAPTWLSDDVISMFSTIALPAPSRQCIQKILQPVNKLSDSDLDRLLNFHERLIVSADDCGVSPMSIRSMKRIVKKGKLLEGGSLYEQLSTSLLTDLLHPTKRAALESVLRSSKIYPNKDGVSKKKKLRVDFDEDNSDFKIGALSVTPLTAKNLQLVPSPIFWDIPSHLRIIQTLLSEWIVGERAFLLLGNQGTGKNKICDRLCELLNHEREYIQLHRDTTIGQLTISPSLENGQIVWNDSPLVRAVINGRALVIDEADKAPLEVVAVLKSLVEDGELLLADGRRILRTDSNIGENEGIVFTGHYNYFEADTGIV